MGRLEKITSFTLDSKESFLLSGTNGGSIFIQSIENLEIIADLRISVGSIEVVAVHPCLPYAAALSMDHTITLVDIENLTKPFIIDRFNSRDIEADNEYFENIIPTQSYSQALSFHPQKVVLATRTGNGALIELELKDGYLQKVRTNRFHDEDLITTRYVNDGKQILSGAARDIVLSEHGKEVFRWTIGDLNHHWFEPIRDDVFLVACDELFAVKIDLKNRDKVDIGPKFMRDDFEHITFNRKSNSAYACGFDADVYKVDPSSLKPVCTIWSAPYKLRWIKNLEKDPNILIIHSFNGSIYRYNIADNRVEARFKKTPNTIWTCCRIKDQLFFAGEGELLTSSRINVVDSKNNIPNITIENMHIKQDNASYTKRIIPKSKESDAILIAQKDGFIRQLLDNRVTEIFAINEQIRDIGYWHKKDYVYICTEQGNVYCIHCTTGDIKASYHHPENKPLWSLAVNETLGVIAVGARRGKLKILSLSNLSEQYEPNHCCSRPKRMKWFDDNLIFVQTHQLKRYSLSENKVHDFVGHCNNTIEDFIWDLEYGYLVLISYTTEVILCDLSSGRKLCVMPDQIDISKGIEWISRENDKNSYPLDFVTFGREGSLRLYRIHNDRITSLGSNLSEVLGSAN
tara:strand:- start:4761 stop:6650 length:1890 start_codon:yes stop_codon:yes gene_type:complete